MKTDLMNSIAFNFFFYLPDLRYTLTNHFWNENPSILEDFGPNVGLSLGTEIESLEPSIRSGVESFE